MLDEAQQEVTREVDRFAVDADALGHGVVDDAQCDRITHLPLQHLRARTYQHKRLHSYACVPANSAMEISVGQGINGPNRLGLAPILEMQATIAYMFWSQKIWHCQYLNTGTGLCKSHFCPTTLQRSFFLPTCRDTFGPENFASQPVGTSKRDS